MQLTRKDFHHGFYVLGTGLLLGSLPLSHFAMGLFTFLLLLNWIAEWDWREKWQRLLENKQGLLFSAFYLVMCIGLIKTDNWHNAGQILLSNLVLFFAPIIIISSKPFSEREMNWLYDAFIIGTFIGCVISVGYWLTHEVADMREISIFIDHIRFSLCIVLAIVLCIRQVARKSNMGDLMRIVYLFVALVLTVYIFLAQTLTGVVVFCLILVVGVVQALTSISDPKSKRITSGLLLGLLCALAVYVTWITVDYFHDRDKTITTTQTALGGEYTFGEELLVENGHKINYYVCRPELQRAWALRSDSTFEGMIEATLIRYLNSKGLHKDYQAVMYLSDKDIRNVERLIANVAYTQPLGLRRALYQTYFSVSKYFQDQSIIGSSFMQRMELWKASWYLAKDNWLLGVGLGDQKTELDAQLVKMNSPIAYITNRGCHNQILTYWLTGGILLICYFMFLLAYPFVGMPKRVTFVYVSLFIIIFCSMWVEDVIDSQTGRMMFAILMPLVLFNEATNKAASEKV